MTKRKREPVRVKRGRKATGFDKHYIAIPKEDRGTVGKGKNIRERVTYSFDFPTHNLRKREGAAMREWAEKQVDKALAATPGLESMQYEIRGRAAFALKNNGRPDWQKSEEGMFNYYNPPTKAIRQLLSLVEAVGDNEFAILAIGNRASSKPVFFVPRTLILRFITAPGAKFGAK